MAPSDASDQVRCPRGHLTSGKFPFCTECGAELDPHGAAEDDVVRCPNGHVVTGGHKFCIECGAPVEQPEAVSAEAEGDDDFVETQPESDIADVDEVRCPKGHLTPGEYPYCIICGAELEKGGAPAPPPAPAPTPAARPAARPTRPRRTVRRRSTPEPVAETPEPDEPEPLEGPDELEDLPLEPPEPTEKVPPTPVREASHVRHSVIDEDETEDADDELEDEPFLSPMSSYAETDTRDEATEHFIHSPAGRERAGASPPLARSRSDRKWVIPVAMGVLAAVALVALILLLRSNHGTTAQPTPIPTTATAVPTHAPAQVSANANVPITVASSSVKAGPSANMYSASAIIKNPTDFTAERVTVTFMLHDATGATIGTVTRTVAALPPGGTSHVVVTGQDPGGKHPTSVAVRAVAAQLKG